MENEDKHSLQRIENGEEIGHDDCAFINVHESKGPGQSQQAEKSYCTYDP